MEQDLEKKRHVSEKGGRKWWIPASEKRKENNLVLSSRLLSQYFPFHSVHDLLRKQMVERSFGRNKLQGRCLRISELRKKMPGRTSHHWRKGRRKGAGGGFDSFAKRGREFLIGTL